MLSSLVTSSRVLKTIDERLMRCGISRRDFVKFCSSLMIAAPFGLTIADKKAPRRPRIRGRGEERHRCSMTGGRGAIRGWH